MSLAVQPSVRKPAQAFSLRELRGALLSVLLALAFTRAPVSRARLERVTGYTRKPVSSALGYFFSQGLASHSPQGWFLTQNGRDHLGEFLGGCIYLPPSINKDLDLKSTDISEDQEERKEQGENLSPPVVNLPPGEISPAITPSSQVLGKTVAQLQGIWEEFKLAGIQRNERTEKLALLPYLTPDYVRGHRLQLEERGKRGARWSGLLITILESGDPAPPVSHRHNGHPDDCACLDCQVWDAQERRYASPPASCDPPEDEQDISLPRPDPSVELPVTPEGISASAAWEALLDQLGREISTPVFVTWIRPSWLYAWNPPAGVFTVCAPDLYARDWLAQRMQSTISRTLTGICARLVSVRFIDPSEIQEHP